jgi:hypothetical protein
LNRFNLTQNFYDLRRSGNAGLGLLAEGRQRNHRDG